MKTNAVRLYGENDLRLEEFEFPELINGEILIKIISDSVCMSTYKTAKQGAQHIRVPDNVAENPVIIGHEFCAEVVEVTDKWKDKFQVGDKVVMPPVLSYLGGMETVGYTFPLIGGVSTYSIVYNHIIENDYLIKLDSDCFFKGSLIEPASCVIRDYKANIHLDSELMPYTNIKPNGKIAILAGCGPMGLVAIDIALHGDIKPSLLVVTDLDKQRLERAKKIFDPEKAKQDGITLIFCNTTQKEELLKISGGGFDDVFVYAPVPAVVELADSILGFDGCLNVRLIGAKKIDPAVMITHIGGIDAAIDTTIRLPEIPGGKKLIYTYKSSAYRNF